MGVGEGGDSVVDGRVRESGDGGCPSCHHIADAEAGRYPWAVARLSAGYVWLNPCQYFPGSTFYVARRCVAELHEMPRVDSAAHLLEMADVAAAIHDEFNVRKMNYEALGNSVAHLHWWLTPRPHDDRRPTGPIWEDLDFLRNLWTCSNRHKARRQRCVHESSTCDDVNRSRSRPASSERPRAGDPRRLSSLRLVGLSATATG